MMTNEQRQFERMVDGELNADQQRVLLETCDCNDTWRQLALAYVESQTLKNELTLFAMDAQSKDDSRTLFVTNDEAVSTNGKPESQTSTRANIQSNSQSTPGVVQNREAAATSGGWSALSLAAAVLLSLGIGYGLGWWLPSDGSVGIAGDPSMKNQTGNHTTDLANQQNDSSTSPRGANSPVSSMQVLVSDPRTNGFQQIDLPVVQASQLGPNWREQIEPNLPEDLLQELRGNGVDLRRTRTYTPVRLRDGRQVIVPIDHFFEQRFQ